MIQTMAENGFGNCSNHYECHAVRTIPAKASTRGERVVIRAGQLG